MSRARIRPIVVVAVVALVAAGAVAVAKPGYYRYPDIHEDRVVFCAEADIWMTTTSGDSARRLTSHPGTEYFPSFFARRGPPSRSPGSTTATATSSSFPPREASPGG